MISVTMKIIFATVFHVLGVFSYDQDGFTQIFEHGDVVSYDHNYVKHFKIVSFKYNRTDAAQNITMTLNVDFGNTLKVEIQAYKMASNEYRLFPIRFAVNLCHTIAENDFGLGRFYNCGNFTKCPLKKGTFFICNFVTDHKKFPPFIPEGSYMLDLKFFTHNTQVIFTRAYGRIKSINKWDTY